MLSQPRRPDRPRHVETAPVVPAQIVEALPLPAALLDRRGRIVVLNQAWQDRGSPGGVVADSDVVGEDYVHELRDEKGFNLEAGRALAQVIEKVLAGDKEHATCEYTIRSDGEGSQWEAAVTRIEGEDEVHVLVVHRDRTGDARMQGMKEKVGTLTVAQERNRAIHEDRLRLVHNAEQNFHGPMTPVRLQLYLLKAGRLGELNDRQKRAIDQVERNVQRLWDLHEQLVADLGALEDADSEREDTDLGALLEEALHPFRERCIQAGVRLRVDRTDDSLPVHADVRSIVQVLLVILDHAIRATPAGGLVWVRLRAAKGHAEITIQDQDPEIDPDLANELLSDDGTTEHRMRGALHHANAVLERHGGTIKTHCAGAGQGLEVTLRLPSR